MDARKVSQADEEEATFCSRNDAALLPLTAGPTNSPRMGFISVIVPIYNDVIGLERCLTALAKQTLPRDRFEVLVVDNGGTADLSGALAAFPNAVCLREETPGSYAARNCGIAHSRGDVLAFTDADCTPHPTWLEHASQRLSLGQRDAIIGGRIEVYAKDPIHPTWAELYDLALAFPQEFYVRVRGYSVTANLVATRRVFAHAGPFDAKLMSGGDKEWCQRAVGQGFRLTYTEDVVVAHPARRSVRELVDKRRRQLGGQLDRALRRYPKPVAYGLVLGKNCAPPVMRLLRMRHDENDSVWTRVYRASVVVGVSTALQAGGAWELLSRVWGSTAKR